MPINRSKEWWIARARSEGDMPIGAGVPDAQPTEDALVKHMVDRFLSWRLPENFSPDAGISFKRTFNEHTAYPMKSEPIGTNLFDAEQTTAMVRYMLDGSNPTPATAEARATKATEHVPYKPAIAVFEDSGITEIALYDGAFIYEDVPGTNYRVMLDMTTRQPAGFAWYTDDAPEQVSLPPPEAKDGAAPSQETGWRETVCGIINRRAAEWRSSGDTIRAREAEDISALVANLPTAPAAPSPDLAALE